MLASQARSRGFESHHPLQRNSDLNSLQKFTKELLEDFLKSRSSGTSHKTITLYHFALDNFIGYPLTPEGINNYLNSLTCGNGKHNYYRCIKTLSRWLYQSGQLSTNPIEKVLPPRRQKRILPAISREQLSVLVNNDLPPKLVAPQFRVPLLF